MSHDTNHTNGHSMDTPHQLIARARQMRADYMHSGMRSLGRRITTAVTAVGLHAVRAVHLPGAPEGTGK
ncbi:MAG: hypothetical protein RIC16_10015 [Rhodospirillales bacterium]